MILFGVVRTARSCGGVGFDVTSPTRSMSENAPVRQGHATKISPQISDAIAVRHLGRLKEVRLAGWQQDERACRR